MTNPSQTMTLTACTVGCVDQHCSQTMTLTACRVEAIWAFGQALAGGPTGTLLVYFDTLLTFNILTLNIIFQKCQGILTSDGVNIFMGESPS